MWLTQMGRRCAQTKIPLAFLLETYILSALSKAINHESCLENSWTPSTQQLLISASNHNLTPRYLGAKQLKTTPSEKRTCNYFLTSIFLNITI
jgi:hypothetical protein